MKRVQENENVYVIGNFFGSVLQWKLVGIICFKTCILIGIL